MSKKDYTHISVLLDRSGSMQSIKDDTEGGFAAFLEEQKKQSGEASIELRQFDTQYEQVYPPTPIFHAPALQLVPRGSTALLDAMGKSINETKQWLSSLPDDLVPENVVFVIITDGYENASREWSKKDVFDLVTSQTEAGWTFLYLGANQDAIQAGADMGIASTNSLTYTGANTVSAYASMSGSVTRTRLAGAAAAEFTDDERAAAAGTPTP